MEPRMRFGDAIEALQASMNDEDSTPEGLQHEMVEAGSGLVASRAGWNGKGMFICLMPAVEIPAQAVTDGSRAGEVVYDPFLGSGTTLIAAEQLGRTCYGMEISPAYCDVIVKRWQDFTGKDATLASSGEKF